MKTLIAPMCVLALAGRASTDGKQQDAATSSDKSSVESRRLAEAAFEEAGGTLNLVFNAQGNWVKITAKGTAAMADDTPEGRETGLMIATMRAKQTVAEFLSSEVGSSKTMTRIATSYSRTYQSTDSTNPVESLENEDNDAAMSQPGGSEESRHAQRLASTLTERIRDCMPVLFELLEQEPHAGVRAVLGHLVFVYIHPYMDGNGRIARFLMNLMLTTGGYVWTVIPVERRAEYMAVLERASSYQDIGPFADFVAGLVAAQSVSPPTRPAGR